MAPLCNSELFLSRSVRRNLFCFVNIVIISLSMLACNSDPEGLYSRGAQLAQQGKFDQAIATFDDLKAISGESDLYLYKSIYGKSEVARLRGDLVAQSDHLEAILAQPRFSEHYPLVREKLEENLLLRAQKERVKPDPSGAIPLYQRAIDLSSKSEARALLSEFLSARAVAALTSHSFDEAIELFERVRSINEGNETLLQQVSDQIHEARFLKYRLSAEQLFARRVNDLIEKKQYDLQTKTFFFKVSAEVIGRVTKKNREDQLKLARAHAESLASEAVASSLRDLFVLSNAPSVDKAYITVTSEEFASRVQSVKREGKRTQITPFHYHFTLPIDAAYRIAFEAQSQMEN